MTVLDFKHDTVEVPQRPFFDVNGLSDFQERTRFRLDAKFDDPLNRGNFVYWNGKRVASITNDPYDPRRRNDLSCDLTIDAAEDVSLEQWPVYSLHAVRPTFRFGIAGKKYFVAARPQMYRT